MNENIEEVMLDLLCKKAVYGLSEHEEKELAELEKTSGAEDRSQSFELAAAAIGVAELDASEPMPANLRSRILADAEKYFDERSDAEATRVSTYVSETSGRGSMFNWLGWAFAAAACLALAANIYYTRPQKSDVYDVAITPSEMRQRLIDTTPDLVRASWGEGNVNDVSPSGDIVWSDSKQAGYMRLTGLPLNDPSKETYQLWIFDETQDDKTPIDGGTFNVNAQGEVIVPINAKLQPRNTKMYAITVEKPGGVVVSKREKIVALAKRET